MILHRCHIATQGPRWSRANAVVFLLAFCLGASSVRAGMLVYALPHLVGDYTYQDLSTYVERSEDFETGLGSYGIASVRIVLKGRVTYGLIRGDGVKVPGADIPLTGGFGVGLSAPGGTVLSISSSQNGEFLMEKTFTEGLQPEVTPLPTPGSGEESGFCGSVHISFAPGMFDFFATLPPRLVPPTEIPFIDWWDGYEVVRPLTGTVTDAYMVIEGPGVPEPTAFAALSLATIAVLHRRKRTVI